MCTCISGPLLLLPLLDSGRVSAAQRDYVQLLAFCSIPLPCSAVPDSD